VGIVPEYCRAFYEADGAFGGVPANVLGPGLTAHLVTCVTMLLVSRTLNLIICGAQIASEELLLFVRMLFDG
jgi:hypothetical protein